MQNYLITSNQKIPLHAMPRCRVQAVQKIKILGCVPADNEVFRFVSIETVVLSDDESWDIEVAAFSMRRYSCDAWGLVERYEMADTELAASINPSQHDVRLWLSAAIASCSSGEVSLEHVSDVESGHIAIFDKKKSALCAELGLRFADSSSANFKLSTFWNEDGLLVGMGHLPMVSLLPELASINEGIKRQCECDFGLPLQ